MKTKAAVLYKTNTPLRIEELEIPTLKKGQVLVKVLATGVCRAQVNERKALKGPDLFLPHLMGHEGAGEIVAVGSGVTKVKKGDYCVLSWIKGEGLEGGASTYNIQHPNSDIQVINAGSITTFSEYAVISENRVVKISRKIPPSIASILGCAVPTGVGIIQNTLKVKKGTSIAIFGAGGVGSSSILGAVMAGCDSIIAIDVTEEKLAFAKHLGATHTIHALNENVGERIRDITNSRGLDYAIEAAGVKAAMEQAFASLSTHGTLAIAGNLKKGETISIVPYDLILGKRIVGSWGGETRPDRDIPLYATKFLEGSLPIDRLISRTYPLGELNTALDCVSKNMSLGRVIVIL